jgi:beta-galactosidase
MAVQRGLAHPRRLISIGAPHLMNARNAKQLLCAGLAGGLLLTNQPSVRADTFETPLVGTWRFQLDRNDLGIGDEWFKRELTQTIALPGILQAQGYGDEISTNTPWVLSLYDKLWFEREDYKTHTQPGNVRVPFVSQPTRHYLGAAWYQRDIEIPKEWEGRRVVLFLERTRWETRAWLDDKLIGTNNSLCTPHEFDFGIVAPGKHRVTVRVDNRMLVNYRPDAHAVSDSLGSTWNGIVGKIELRSTPPVWIEEIQIFPQSATQSALVRVSLGNATAATTTNDLFLAFIPKAASGGGKPAWQKVIFDSPRTTIEMEVQNGYPFKTWDEFQPELFELTVATATSVPGGKQYRAHKRMTFGFRDFKTSGQEFIINGRPTMLRGTHHGGDFPLTGYPPCDVEYWRKLFQTCKAWDLNHVRFHSFCPPEAAFVAADEIGIYLQIEPGMWNEISPGTPMERRLYDETERIIKYYGNHPSFVLLSPSNEPKGRWKEALPKWVKHFRERDPRHLYTTGTGWSLIDEPQPVADKVDYLAVHRIGLNMMRGNSAWFGRDYARSMRGVDVPNLVHENGQWCAYPDFDVIKKFTGFIRPGNFEIFRDSAAANGVLEYNKQFAHASGRFQLACYKEEIEAILRTPGLGGFQMLDLHDYTGQGTALVGLLDPFWEEKGYVNAREWRQFCSETVPLARLTKRVFTTSENFEAEIEVTHYGLMPKTNVTISWHILDASIAAVANGKLAPQTLRWGRNPALGRISAALSNLPAPAAYRLVVKGQDSENSWNFWLYPAQVLPAADKDVFVTSSWPAAESKLAAGGKVLLLPRNADLDWSSPPLDNLPVFWNRLMSPQWGRMIGLWCDPNHPTLAGFPTKANCDWQWTQITKGTRAVNIGKLPRELKPVVAAIDDWNRNWKLAPIFEAKVGKGKLLVCSFDITTKLDERVVARQLRRSLLDYIASDKFQPAVSITPEQLRALWFDTLVMPKLGATVTASSGNGRKAMDGDPNTAWLAGGRGRGADGRSHPHTLTISFTNAIAMTGVVLLNRQNDRDHLGDIRDYVIELSDDGKTWRTVVDGTLPSTWNPQTIPFANTETATSLRLTALSGYGTDASAALAEFAVQYAGPQLPENSDNAVAYQRVRSTASDVDEGPTTVPATKPKP